MKKSFTLIELLIVLVIIGVLATLAIPQYQNYKWKTQKAEAYTNLSAFRKACLAYRYETGDLSNRPDLEAYSTLGTDVALQRQNVIDINDAFGTNLPTGGIFYYVFDRCDGITPGNPDWQRINFDFSVNSIKFGDDGRQKRITIWGDSGRLEEIGY